MIKSISELLNNLHSLDVKIWVDGNTIRYDAPKETLTPTLLKQLRERKAEILAFLQNSHLPPILPVTRNKNLPLSFAQQRLWFLEQLEPNKSTYCIASVYRLTGSLNVSALEQSLNELVQRHEILRTTFLAVNGEPVQVISKETGLILPLINLQELSPNHREAEARRQAIQEAQCPFNLAQGPLFRAKLLRLNAQEYVLLLNMHHIISDGWSFDVSFGELATLYQAFANKQPSPLPRLSIQYADFAFWQREWLQGEILQSQLDYWRQQLKGKLLLLQLPTDYPRPLVKTYKGDYQSLEISKDLTKLLKAFSQQEGVTLFMTLLAAFQTLLFRYSGQTDIIVGSPIAARNQEQTHGLIGFFINTLVLRTDLSGDPSFRDLLCRVREVALGAYTHQDLPFEKLLEELQPQRDQSRTPLFEVMFVLQKTSQHILELPGLTLTPLEVHSETAKFDLTLDLQETFEGIKGRFEYNTDLFNAATIARMCVHFQTLLESIVLQPQQVISLLPLLTAKQHQLLTEWNNTQADYPQDKYIYQLFENQVKNTPDSIALKFANEQLTYKELNNRANQLAHYIQKMGVKANVLVGICLESTLDLLVGLLGILKAGGAYVPLDPTYPCNRIAFMLEDTQAPVLLTQQHLLELLANYRGHIACLDKDWSVISQESTENINSEVILNNLAYIIYTSGSTGKPKGIAMRHRCLSNLISWQIQNTTVDSKAKTLQFASINFDVSYQEIFSTLCSGGTLILLSEQLRQDTISLLRLIITEGIARLFLPVVALKLLAEIAETQKLITTNVREIITAGEQLQITPQIRQLFKQLNGCTLHNQYGPSESHVVTAFTLKGSPLNWPVLVPIGRPLANTQIYILDSQQQLVPIGLPGEVYIGGDGVGQGYLNQPSLTAEKFIPNPFDNSKLYKTGDLARYLPDGNIEFLGRLDDQVKVRGFRIELGEIETAIAQHSNVQQTIVIAREDSPDDKRIVAYIIPQQGQTLAVDDLRHFLKQKLPEYMIPEAFIFLEAFPLTPSKKIDRRALPAPNQSRPELQETFIAPRTSIEQQIADIWACVLKLEKVGIHDNFFALGGHSLLLAQVISQLHQAFNLDIPLRTLFEAPTVAQLSNHLETICWTTQKLQIPESDAASNYVEIEL